MRDKAVCEKRLDGRRFAELVAGGAANLGANASVVNDLNVFPIPDGDTGENMSRTILGGVRAIEGRDEPSIGRASEIMADGMLMSARGNSGVILSQIFAGIAAGFKGMNSVDVREFAAALQSGVKSAYAAVVTPTEGTILTVARESAEYARSRIRDDTTWDSFGRDYLHEMGASLKRTPELLSVLKEAGVIDSGGAGLYYIADGAYRTYLGESIARTETGDKVAKDVADYDKFGESDVMVYGYCTECLLRLQNTKVDIDAFSVDELIKYLGTVGDSIVAFKTGSTVKVHVHTMTPGRVLEHLQMFGEFLTVKIENMTIRHNETVIKNEFVAHDGEKSAARKKFATIAVASGEGIRRTFSELGADFVIDGGQSQNPSAKDFVNAFDAVNAETIFVLPDNGNIIMAAMQAAKLYDKSDVRVIESKNIGQGYAALTMLSYDSADADTIAAELTSATEGVVTGMISPAVRAANINGVEIHENDYIGFTDKTMLVSAKNRLDAALKLSDALLRDEHEIVIAVYGKAVGDDEREAFRRETNKKYPGTELYEIDGRQDTYDYYLIAE